MERERRRTDAKITTSAPPPAKSPILNVKNASFASFVEISSERAVPPRLSFASIIAPEVFFADAEAEENDCDALPKYEAACLKLFAAEVKRESSENGGTAAMLKRDSEMFLDESEYDDTALEMRANELEASSDESALEETAACAEESESVSESSCAKSADSADWKER